jgi:hypothetical protein
MHFSVAENVEPGHQETRIPKALSQPVQPPEPARLNTTHDRNNEAAREPEKLKGGFSILVVKSSRATWNKST